MWTSLRRLFTRVAKETPDNDQAFQPHSDPSGLTGAEILAVLRWQLADSDDLIVRTFQAGPSGGAVVYIDGMVDATRVESAVLRPLFDWSGRRWDRGGKEDVPEINLDRLRGSILAVSDPKEVSEPGKALGAVLSGDVLVILDNEPRALVISNKGGKARGVEDPFLEVTIRGPRDSFTETLSWNVALVRRRVQDSNLRVQFLKIGRRSQTQLALLSIKGITPDGLVEEVKKRVEAIEIDAILDTGYIEHLIEDEWWSPFPQHLKTERPDKVVASLMEGRAVLLADATPLALMMPATLDSFFHSPEDHYDRWFPANLLRWVRFIGAFLAITAPALYLALAAYHPGILPTQFLLRATAAREGVAFPVLVEALFMQFFLELIKEAGFRLPSPIGQIFGIVGGLVLGQMGVQAGIVSEAMVIVVAITAISSFAVIDRELGTILRLLGLPVMLSAAILGLPGLMMAMMLIGIHLAILRSYGVPYLSPYPYYEWADLKDTVVIAPLRFMDKRPHHLGADQRRRLRPGHDPKQGGSQS